MDRAREKGLQKGVVDFGRRGEGSLGWTPQPPGSALEDVLVTSAFRHLVEHLQPAAARELGRAMGRSARGVDIEPYLVAFSHLGLGCLTLLAQEGGRFTVMGHDLVGSLAPHAASCALALGFLEGLARAVSGRDALGAEMQCRSRGHAKCSFVVHSR